MSTQDLIILGTSSQQPTRYRNHGAYLFRWHAEGLLFDPGEGTQRQFIFAEVAPTCVTRIFISHFHGDHCLGVGSMLMRLNLDKVSHPIHCYYPASGKKYFDRLRYGTAYHEHITVIEHPIEKGGVVEKTEHFSIEAEFLDHGVENLGWRISEHDKIRFDPKKLTKAGLFGPMVAELKEKKKYTVKGKEIFLEEVSSVIKGATIAVIIDTRPTPTALRLSQNARLLLAESTYLDSEKELAISHKHLTATEAAQLAAQAQAKMLVLTHFSARYQDVRVFEEEAQKIFPQSYAAHDLQRFHFNDPR